MTCGLKVKPANWKSELFRHYGVSERDAKDNRSPDSESDHD